MSVLATTRVILAAARDPKRAHRLRLTIAYSAAIALTVALIVYGFSYYTLSLADRVYSPKHLLLRPSGTIGLRLGMLAAILFLLVYLYPLRMRWAWLGSKGNSRHWLDFHVLLGLTAPVLITFHSSFKFRGVAGIAYWIMVTVAFSGLVGRYFYAQIPRSLHPAEMSLKEMREESERLAAQLSGQKVPSLAELNALFPLPDVAAVQAMPLFTALWRMIWIDLSHPWRVVKLRRRVRRAWSLRGELISGPSAEFERVIALASRQVRLAKAVIFLSKSRRLFHLWHVVHRPFSYSFAVLALVHIAVMLLLGYF